MNKKGFTLIELLAVISLLAILLVFAVFSYSRYLKIGKDKILKVDINTMEDATLSAFTDCVKDSTGAFCVEYPLPEAGNKAIVWYSDLIKYNNIDEFKNPYNKDEYCDSSNSYVEVTRKATTTLTGETDSSDISFDYVTCLRCGEKNSQARFKMAKILKDKNVGTDQIMNCTELTLNQVNGIN